MGIYVQSEIKPVTMGAKPASGDNIKLWLSTQNDSPFSIFELAALVIVHSFFIYENIGRSASKKIKCLELQHL